MRATRYKQTAGEIGVTRVRFTVHVKSRNCGPAISLFHRLKTFLIFKMICKDKIRYNIEYTINFVIYFNEKKKTKKLNFICKIYQRIPRKNLTNFIYDSH